MVFTIKPLDMKPPAMFESPVTKRNQNLTRLPAFLLHRQWSNLAEITAQPIVQQSMVIQFYFSPLLLSIINHLWIYGYPILLFTIVVIYYSPFMMVVVNIFSQAS